jgi:ribonuclease T2
MLPIVVGASAKIDGYFIAQKSCEAVHSIKKGTYPFTIQKGMAYKVKAKNRAFQATHYLIYIDQLEKNPNRWIPIDCGLLLTGCKTNQVVKKSKSEKEYLLALSWQAAFCQSHKSKTECQTQRDDRYDATHFSLHGLWPQPRNSVYCGVSDKDKSIDRRGYWHLLDPLTLSENTFSNLIISMPGVASYLQRHEWIKHGTCYSNLEEVYYRDSLSILGQINDTNISTLFANNINNIITLQEIRKRFDESFGIGVGKKVDIQCDKNGLIVDLWINLKGDIGRDKNLSILLKNAPTARKSSKSCESGRVDSVGF